MTSHIPVFLKPLCNYVCVQTHPVTLSDISPSSHPHHDRCPSLNLVLHTRVSSECLYHCGVFTSQYKAAQCCCDLVLYK